MLRGQNAVAVAGGKGGCGKTTTALGLALAADRMGRSTLAVDADVDVPDLHRLAGLDPPGADPRPRPVEGAPRAEVLPAPPGADPGDLAGRLPDSPTAYDQVLLDCPAGAGRDAAVPLRAADRTLLVATADPASLRDAAKTAAMSRAVGTPVAAAVLTGTASVPEGVAGVLDTGSVVPLPPADRPLHDETTIDRLRRVVGRLGGAPGHSV
jgi:septum site-determining protein MinD